MDRESGNLSPSSIRFYRQKLTVFLRSLADEGVTDFDSLRPVHIRAFMVKLKGDHTPGGVHAYYRAIKVFCRWLHAEEEISSDLMDRIRAPRVSQELLEPVENDVIRALLDTCNLEELIGVRDYAVILFLLDTGLRASELLGVNVGDVEIETGRVKVRHTKNGRQRVAFVGEHARVALGRYLEFREASLSSPLWTTREERRLTYTGLRDILRRRSKRAGVPAPTLHAFRRSFALLCLRGGMDVYSLQKLMGHSDLSILRRYLAQTEGDLRDAHAHASPVDGQL
jgi:integrase/recombinase XerD